MAIVCENLPWTRSGILQFIGLIPTNLSDPLFIQYTVKAIGMLIVVYKHNYFVVQLD